MFSKWLDFQKPNMAIAKVSLIAFVLASFPVPILEFFYGKYTIFGKPWVYIGVGFHEIGHFLAHLITEPILLATGFLGFLAVPMNYLGGFLFNGFAGIVLLAFSLAIQFLLSEGKLSKKSRSMAFSFLFIAYINIFLVPYTLTHLQHVVGNGADFTMASSLLGMTLDHLLVWVWAVNWIVLVLALLLNIFFIFRKRG